MIIDLMLLIQCFIFGHKYKRIRKDEPLTNYWHMLECEKCKDLVAIGPNYEVIYPHDKEWGKLAPETEYEKENRFCINCDHYLASDANKEKGVCFAHFCEITKDMKNADCFNRKNKELINSIEEKSIKIRKRSLFYHGKRIKK